MTASKVQVGGAHYKDMQIQPMEFALANNLNYGQSNAIKYICRYKNKNGIEDLKKAIHCIELLIEHETKQSALSHENDCDWEQEKDMWYHNPDIHWGPHRIDIIGSNGNDGEHYVK